MSFWFSLRSELLKTKRTPLFFLCVLVAAIIPVMLLFEYSTDERAAYLLKDEPWNLYFREGRQALNILFLPMYIILTCTLLPQIEYRNNTWKQVFTTPQSLSNIFFAKFLILHLLILIFLIAYNLLMAASAVVIQLFNSHFTFFKHSINSNDVMLSNERSYVAILAISATQFWLGIRFKNFITPIAIGFVLWMIAGLMVYEFEWEQAYYFPFAYPILHLLTHFQFAVPFITKAAFVYTFIILLLAFIDFKRKCQVK